MSSRPNSTNPNLPSFKSFVSAGFECTYALPQEKARIDVLAATKHDVLCKEDYQLIAKLGIKTVREGLSWSEIDRGKEYDFSRFEVMMKIAAEEGVEQIWDLNHFDYPQHLDPFSPEFVESFARYARAAVRILRKYVDGPLWIVPWNEISFFSWIAGEKGTWAPFAQKSGFALKIQLVKAVIAAMQAMREEDADVHFIHTDPVMYRKGRGKDQKAHEIAKQFNEIKFQSWDMISGRMMPELGGKPEYLEIVGINYYFHNQQWIMKDKSQPGEYIPWSFTWGSPHRVSFANLLKEIYARYERPLFIAETGSHGGLRAKWWKRTLREIDAARKEVPITGVCAYPVLDYPDWYLGHFTNSGLWDFHLQDVTCKRIPHTQSIKYVHDYQRLNSRK